LHHAEVQSTYHQNENPADDEGGTHIHDDDIDYHNDGDHHVDSDEHGGHQAIGHGVGERGPPVGTLGAKVNLHYRPTIISGHMMGDVTHTDHHVVHEELEGGHKVIYNALATRLAQEEREHHEVHQGLEGQHHEKHEDEYEHVPGSETPGYYPTSWGFSGMHRPSGKANLGLDHEGGLSVEHTGNTVVDPQVVHPLEMAHPDDIEYIGHPDSVGNQHTENSEYRRDNKHHRIHHDTNGQHRHEVASIEKDGQTDGEEELSTGSSVKKFSGSEDTATELSLLDIEREIKHLNLGDANDMKMLSDIKTICNDIGIGSRNHEMLDESGRDTDSKVEEEAARFVNLGSERLHEMQASRRSQESPVDVVKIRNLIDQIDYIRNQVATIKKREIIHRPTTISKLMVTTNRFAKSKPTSLNKIASVPATNITSAYNVLTNGEI